MTKRLPNIEYVRTGPKSKRAYGTSASGRLFQITRNSTRGLDRCCKATPVDGGGDALWGASVLEISLLLRSK